MFSNIGITVRKSSAPTALV